MFKGVSLYKFIVLLFREKSSDNFILSNSLICKISFIVIVNKKVRNFILKGNEKYIFIWKEQSYCNSSFIPHFYTLTSFVLKKIERDDNYHVLEIY